MPAGSCLSCQVAYPSILFSDDLNSITIKFDFDIEFNVPDPGTKSNANCLLLIKNVVLLQLGTNPQCYLSPARTVVIEVGSNPTIKTADLMKINNNYLREVGCVPYINTLIDEKIYPPTNLLSPYVTLDNPLLRISLCQSTTIAITA